MRVLEQIVYLLLGPVRHTSACRVAVESDRAPPAARASARAGKQSKQFAAKCNDKHDMDNRYVLFDQYKLWRLWRPMSLTHDVHTHTGGIGGRFCVLDRCNREPALPGVRRCRSRSSVARPATPPAECYNSPITSSSYRPFPLLHRASRPDRRAPTAP